MSGKRKLPPKVHAQHGRYFWVDRNKWHPLSRIDEGVRELHRRLALLPDAPPSTLTAIFTAYAERGMADLAKPTRDQYEYFLFGILNDTFGHMLPVEIDEGTIAQYLERRKLAGAAVSGNRERACLSSVFEYAMRQGWAKRNPCRGVRRNRERPSRASIDSADLSRAIDRAPAHFGRVLQLGYLTGMRMSDLIALEVSAVTPRGLEYTESKTGKPVLVERTPTLGMLLGEILEARAALKRPPDHGRLLVNRFGAPLTQWGIISNMRRLGVSWPFRAVRAKAQTDAGDRNVLGHSGQMRERYTRRRRLSPVR